MKVSICFPQYNRIEYLLHSLSIIENQLYQNIEICISDDASTDDTENKISELINHYNFPIIYERFGKNQGYDRNYRRCIEISSGDYAFVLGNDDSLNGNDAISKLVDFLNLNPNADIGFCNMVEEISGNTLIERAKFSKVIGSGPEIALNNYSSFSFVGGLIYKRNTFLEYNTDKYDKSIYTQMYLAVLMIASGCKLFSIKEPLVIKDIVLDEIERGSYRDRLIRNWKDFKAVDGGLPSVINVLINALHDSNSLTQKRIYKIFSRIYFVTYTFWLFDYRKNKAFVNAVGLSFGLLPFKNSNFQKLHLINKIKNLFIYCFSTSIGLLFPVYFFEKMKSKLYKFFKN